MKIDEKAYNEMMLDRDVAARQRDELLATLKETWCASQDHRIGEDSKSSNACPICKDERAAIERAESEISNLNISATNTATP